MDTRRCWLPNPSCAPSTAAAGRPQAAHDVASTPSVVAAVPEHRATSLRRHCWLPGWPACHAPPQSLWVPPMSCASPSPLAAASTHLCRRRPFHPPRLHRAPLMLPPISLEKKGHRARRPFTSPVVRCRPIRRS